MTIVIVLLYRLLHLQLLKYQILILQKNQSYNQSVILNFLRKYKVQEVITYIRMYKHKSKCLSKIFQKFLMLNLEQYLVYWGTSKETMAKTLHRAGAA